jgi:hypothetical protein
MIDSLNQTMTQTIRLSHETIGTMRIGLKPRNRLREVEGVSSATECFVTHGLGVA